MIKLIDEYYADSDGRQYVLKEKCVGERKNPDTGEKEKTVIYYERGFYGTMTSCIEGCIRKALMKRVDRGELNTMNEWLNELKAIRNDIKSNTEGL